MLNRVLIADDDPAIRRALARELRRDFEVIAVGGYDAAMTKLDRDATIGVVVSDYDLGPGKDGIELLTEVAKRSPDAVRVLISATCDVELTDRAVANGTAHVFIAKPWTAGTVLAALKEHRARRAGGKRPSSPPGG